MICRDTNIRRALSSRRKQGGFILNPFWFGGETDPLFASVVLLAHMDGSHGGTTFTDSSSYARTLTQTGSSTSTTQQKFGGSSAYFSGSAAYVSGASSVDFQIFAGDFAIEFWAYYASAAGNQCMLQLGSGASNRLNISLVANILTVYGDTVGNYITTAAPSLNTWNFIQLVRNAGTMTLGVNGSAAGSTYGGSTFPTGNLGINIGSNRGQGSVEDYTGYIDDVRITKGQPRTIALRTAAFPNS